MYTRPRVNRRGRGGYDLLYVNIRLTQDDDFPAVSGFIVTEIPRDSVWIRSLAAITRILSFR